MRTSKSNHPLRSYLPAEEGLDDCDDSEEEEDESGYEGSGVYPQQPYLTNPPS